ncbi:MAG: TetR/AcrR family transcriptional regulator [Acidimicrobiales bacterium]
MVIGGASGRSSGEPTRARIVEVALELIADHGFSATTTREISERLGFTKAALYYHFRTKDDLLAAIVAPAMSDLEALVEDARPVTEPVVRCSVLAGYVDLVAGHADLVRVLSADPGVRHSPALASATPLYERLAQLLAGVEAPATVERVRVRAALGAVHAALVHAEPGEDPAVVRSAALAAACGALGVPMAKAG